MLGNSHGSSFNDAVMHFSKMMSSETFQSVDKSNVEYDCFCMRHHIVSRCRRYG